MSPQKGIQTKILQTPLEQTIVQGCLPQTFFKKTLNKHVQNIHEVKKPLLPPKIEKVLCNS